MAVRGAASCGLVQARSGKARLGKVCNGQVW